MPSIKSQTKDDWADEDISVFPDVHISSYSSLLLVLKSCSGSPCTLSKQESVSSSQLISSAFFWLSALAPQIPLYEDSFSSLCVRFRTKANYCDSGDIWNFCSKISRLCTICLYVFCMLFFWLKILFITISLVLIDIFKSSEIQSQFFFI